MIKQIFMIGAISVLFFSIVSLSLAKSCVNEDGLRKQMTQTDDATTCATKKAAVDVGNKICPVSKHIIKEETKATYEYEGKIYNLCCAACIEEFKNDPGKYIKIIEEQENTE